MSDREVLLRSFVLVRGSDTGTDGRTLQIRAVPWDTETQIGSAMWESFQRGAFDPQMRAAHRVPLTLGHPPARGPDVVPMTDRLVGRLVTMDNTDDGLVVQARMATSSVANEALALVNDGMIDQVSVGFIPIKTSTQQRATGGKLYRRESARLDHLALLGLTEGAYGEGAKILSVREKSGPTLDDLRAIVDRLPKV